MTATAAGNASLPAAAAEARVKALYSVMQSIENKLGGGEGVEGLYGSIKKSGMDKVLECMQHQCGLDGSSVLVDVGAGLGRPLMHALLEPGIKGGLGIEIDRIKCDKAAAFLKQAVAELQRRGLPGVQHLTPPEVQCRAIEQVKTLDPCTHAYSFWEGVPVEGKAAFGALFAASSTLRSVAVVQRAIRTCPLAYMEDLGFGELQLVASFSVSMSGSGRSFTAYVFNKAQLPLQLPAPVAVEQGAAHSVETPALGADGRAADSLGRVYAQVAAGVDTLDGETAQSRLAAAGGRGRRQRRPSARQQEAEEGQHAQQAPVGAGGAGSQPRSARERRAQQRAEAVWAAAKAAGSQQEQQQASVPAALAQQQAQHAAPAAAAVAPAPTSPVTRSAAARASASSAASKAQAAAAPVQPTPAAAAAGGAGSSAGSPEGPAASKASRVHSASRPAAAATAPSTRSASAKLGSPQKAGVQKRASPTKPSSGGQSTATPRSPQKATRASAAAAAVAADLAPAGKGGAGVAEVPLMAGSAGVLQRAARVLKGGLELAAEAGPGAKLRSLRSAGPPARRGLLPAGSRMAS